MNAYSYARSYNSHNHRTSGRAGRTLHFHDEDVTLVGDLTVPSVPIAVVLMAHVSASGHAKPRNYFLAHALARAGLPLRLSSRSSCGVSNSA